MTHAFGAEASARFLHYLWFLTGGLNYVVPRTDDLDPVARVAVEYVECPPGSRAGAGEHSIVSETCH